MPRQLIDPYRRYENSLQNLNFCQSFIIYIKKKNILIFLVSKIRRPEHLPRRVVRLA